jgi:hypothetical protein
MVMIETTIYPAPIVSQQIVEEQAIAIAPSPQEIYFAVQSAKDNKRSSWESLDFSDFSCRPSYLIGLRYGDPPLNETFVSSGNSSSSVTTFSRVPPAFDSRQTWPDHVGESVNQGPCGLCWAIAWAGVMSDRFAIGYRGNYTIGDLSPSDLQACAQNSPSCATSPSSSEIINFLVNVGIGKSNCFRFSGALERHCRLQCDGGGRPTRSFFFAFFSLLYFIQFLGTEWLVCLTWGMILPTL